MMESQNGQEGKEHVNAFAYGIQRKAECPGTCGFSPSISFDLIEEIYIINLAGSVRTFARPQPQGNSIVQATQGGPSGSLLGT